MAGRKDREVWQYGDFQTPTELAHQVCAVLVRRGIAPAAVLEPTCGRGAFLEAATVRFTGSRQILGFDINPYHVNDARQRLGSSAHIEIGDFFTIDWPSVLTRDAGPWLVLGNPPWVTNAELGQLKSTNLPTKSNFQGHKGLDALTGKANFDISEWMLLKQLDWLRDRSGWIAMLVKTSVARKLLRQAWRREAPVGRAAIYKIDAMQHFGAAVDACLFVLPVSIGDPSKNCDVFASLEASEPETTIGLHDEFLVSDVQCYLQHRHLVGPNKHYVWRSGVKHDCAKVMELSGERGGLLTNGLGEKVQLEPGIVFPLLKSSDVSKGRIRADRFMIVPQRETGEDTAGLSRSVPKTWRYLLDHASLLDARGSVIYRGRPRFSIFGIGPYAFAPWKVAISGFYKTPHFMKVGPIGGRPVMMDDTIYFLSCQSAEEAEFIHRLVCSRPFAELLGALVFNDEKRPITAELLKRIALDKIAAEMGLADDYAAFTRQPETPQLRLALG